MPGLQSGLGCAWLAQVRNPRRPRAGLLVVLAAAVALGPGAAVAAAPVTGVIAQKQGRTGCISLSGTGGGCARGRVLEAPRGIALSADGRSAYVASPIGGIAVLDRDNATGVLTQKAGRAGCLSEFGNGGCQETIPVGAEYAVAVSPDDRSVYSAGLDGLSIFDRDPASGALTQKPGKAGCFDRTEEACTRNSSIDWPQTITISPDGLHVYVSTDSEDRLVIFDRDATGALRPKAGRDGCVSADGSAGRCTRGGFADALAVAVSPDGRNVYVTASNGVSIFDRAPVGTLRRKPGPAGCVTDSGSGGRCANGKALSGHSYAAISPDGRSLYVTFLGSHVVAIFDRDPATGALAQKRGRAGCVSDTGSGGRCTNGKALREARHVAISPDGLSLYVGGVEAISIFDRDAATGTLRQKRGRAGCVAESGLRGICANGKALRQPSWLTVSPEGTNVYAGARRSNAVAIFNRR